MRRQFQSISVGWKEGAAFLLGLFVIGSIWGGIQLVNQQKVALPYKKNSLSIKWLPATVRRFETLINQNGEKYNTDPNLIAIIMILESGGYTQADSGQALGLMQVTPYTGQDIAKKYLKKPVDTFDLKKAETSIEFGTAYIAHLRDTFCDHTDGPKWDSCVELIAAGYNGGPGAANRIVKGEGLIDTQTVIYSRNAFNMWRERSVERSPTYERWLEAGGQQLVDKAKSEK